MYNALAALAVADELAIPRSVSSEALYAYTGVQRRFQEKGNAMACSLSTIMLTTPLKSE
ncbi:MAG: hypothetical protein R3B54_18975 [Bdellovibrionota bacterium]